MIDAEDSFQSESLGSNWPRGNHCTLPVKLETSKISNTFATLPLRRYLECFIRQDTMICLFAILEVS